MTNIFSALIFANYFVGTVFLIVLIGILVLKLAEKPKEKTLVLYSLFIAILGLIITLMRTSADVFNYYSPVLSWFSIILFLLLFALAAHYFSLIRKKIHKVFVPTLVFVYGLSVVFAVLEHFGWAPISFRLTVGLFSVFVFYLLVIDFLVRSSGGYKLKV